MPLPSTQDRTEIYELYARYSWAVDTGDTDAYVALFTEDAEATEDFPGHQHQMGQFVLSPDPANRPDHWVVRSYRWATISRPPAAPHLHWCGHVRDGVAKVNGSWLVRSKAIMGWSGAVLARFQER